MFANLGLQAALLGLIWWIFKLIMGASWTSTGMIVPIVYLLFTMI